MTYAGFGSSISSRLNKIVASTLSFIDLKTKLVYVDTDAFIAEYDAATDTIRVGNRGLNETAILHELVHAGTVKTISDVLSGKEKNPVKVEAVKRLKALMNNSKKTLGNTYVIDKNGEVVKDKDGRSLILKISLTALTKTYMNLLHMQCLILNFRQSFKK
jgi:hypothetical protein